MVKRNKYSRKRRNRSKRRNYSKRSYPLRERYEGRELCFNPARGYSISHEPGVKENFKIYCYSRMFI